MKAFITGGSGFVGTHLTRLLVDNRHEVTVVARSDRGARQLPGTVNFITADTSNPGSWQESVGDHDVLINLAGATIFNKWNDAYKSLMRQSRISTTRNLVEAIPEKRAHEMVLLSTSAVGYYGFTGDEALDEGAARGDDFLALLARDWEAEATRAHAKGTRVAIMRFGVVLGSDGGALEQMVRPFRFFVGGPLGSGRQWVSWVHVNDLCRAAMFLIQNSEIVGPVNFTAPNPVTNGELARAIGKVLGRPAFMPAPGFMIKLVLGEMGSVILQGQRVVPRVLLDKGFTFQFPRIEVALKNLL